jgi:alkaline phosphatase D
MPLMPFDRRGFIKALSSAAGAGWAASWSAGCGDGGSSSPSPSPSRPVPRVLQPDQGRVFDLSVASGDPSATGVILWTHLRPEEVVAGRPLFFQVAPDAGFSTLILEGEIPAGELRADRDYTVRVDLDGRLSPGAVLFYRFIYGDRASRVGRCRTLPPAGVSSITLAMLSCQDFTNGYYGAYKHLADDDVDFVVHLGDFIYESAGDPRFQTLPFADRQLLLPSGAEVAMGLDDYRSIYRSYRRDADFQRALERHTFIVVSDDHETANDCYWDYGRDTLGAPDHPLRNDAGGLRRLKLEAQRAWTEYVPARVIIDDKATHPHRYVKQYRELAFGDLVRYLALDTRSYRSAHPCGEGDVFQRYLPLACGELAAPARTILGDDQRSWVADRLAASGSTWKVMGNQTFFGRLSLGGLRPVPVNVDAWDGFEAERRWLTTQLQQRNVSDLVILTGDLHSTIAAEVKADYGAGGGAANLLGVEFMTPSVTSSALFDTLLRGLGGNNPALSAGLGGGAVRLANPHIKFFDSAAHGYATIRFTRDHCEWTAYAVDKDLATGASRRVLARFRKDRAAPSLIEQPT